MARTPGRHQIGALLFASALALGIVATPAAAATHNVSIPMSCHATPSGVPIGGKDFHASGIHATVNAPKTIELGQTGQVSFQIHPIHIRMPKLPLGAKFVDASRMKVDFRIPDGLQFMGAQIFPGESSLRGFTAKQVNDSGNADPNGTILRLVGTDDATVGNSPNVSVNKAGGIIIPVDAHEMTVSFPRIVVTFKGTQLGSHTFAVNALGKAGEYDADENFFSILVHVDAPLIGNVWASARCTPRHNEKDPITLNTTRVATITVTDPAQEIQDDTLWDIFISVSPAHVGEHLNKELQRQVPPASGASRGLLCKCSQPDN